MSGNSVKLRQNKFTKEHFTIEVDGQPILLLSESELDELLFQYWAYKLDQHVEGGTTDA